MQDFIFFVTPPTQARQGGWQFSVGSVSLKVHGPFPDRARAQAALNRLERRWVERAEAVGGRFRVVGPGEWVVSVPEGTPIRGLRYSPQTESPRKGADPRDDPPLLRRGPWKVR